MKDKSLASNKQPKLGKSDKENARPCSDHRSRNSPAATARAHGKCLGIQVEEVDAMLTLGQVTATVEQLQNSSQSAKATSTLSTRSHPKSSRSKKSKHHAAETNFSKVPATQPFKTIATTAASGHSRHVSAAGGGKKKTLAGGKGRASVSSRTSSTQPPCQLLGALGSNCG